MNASVVACVMPWGNGTGLTCRFHVRYTPTGDRLYLNLPVARGDRQIDA
jgi:hypothetical protein